MIRMQEITNECLEWCREQHFIHHSNLDTELMLVPCIALLLLILRNVYYMLEDYIKTDDREKTRRYVDIFGCDMAMCLIAGFLIGYLVVTK